MRLLKSIVISLILFFVITSLCQGASLNLAWNPNGEGDLAGYYVYFGTSPGSYGNPIDVANVTEYELSGLDADVLYYVAITAYDTSNNESEKSDEESGVPTDAQNPGENPLNASIIINNGEPVTDSPEVTLTLFATIDRPVPATSSPLLAAEELGPDALMSISNDGQQWSPIEPYSQTKPWTLEPGEGTKTVYAQFSEGDGRWMTEPAQAQITLETDEVSQSACVEPQKIQPLSVTASSESPRNPAYKLIDGDPSTVWSSKISLFKKDQSITLDLGATKKISGLTMYASQLFGVDFFPTSFTIQASQDGATWVDISNEQGYVFGLSLSSGNWETNGLESRYIRIHITQSKTLFLLFKLAQIGEIEVYGCNTAGDIPLLAGEKLPGAGSEQQQISTPSTSANKTENSNMALSAPGRPAVKFLK